ncbi:MAG: hypothetical protein ACI9G1_005989 [Pirellulaceae bacterium]
MLAAKFPLVGGFSEELALVGTTVSEQYAIGGYGFIDKTGELKIPGTYEQAMRFGEGLAAVKQNGKFGFINVNGKLVIECKYRFVEDFRDGIARCRRDIDTPENNIDFIDKTGEMLFRVREDDVGYLNRQFEFEIKIETEMAGERYFLGGQEFHEGLAQVAIGHKSGERKD